MKAMYSLPAKKRKLDHLIKTAIIIEDCEDYKKWDGVTVIKKCVVSLDFGDGEETFTILGYNESDIDNNILSCEAPLSLALYGHKAGETILFNDMKIIINSVSKVQKNNTKKLVK